MVQQKKKKELNTVVMSEQDYRLMKRFVEQAPAGEGLALEHELERAVIVHKYAFPPHTVALNSNVQIEELSSKRTFQVTIVAPAQANATQKRISVLSPLCTALIGFRKGEEIEWTMPGGKRRFRILEVINEAA